MSQSFHQDVKLLLGSNVKFRAEVLNYPRTINLILNYFKDVFVPDMITAPIICSWMLKFPGVIRVGKGNEELSWTAFWFFFSLFPLQPMLFDLDFSFLTHLRRGGEFQK